MNSLHFDNILLISGSGRNSGKTTLACNIIKHLSKSREVIGLKISPHVHLTGKNQEIIMQEEHFSIFRESDSNSGKDSSRMLDAGAMEVYFVLCDDENLWRIEKNLIKIASKGYPVICESGSFAKRYTPGLHILVKGENPDNAKKSYRYNLEMANLVVLSEKAINEAYSQSIDYRDGWIKK